MKMVYFIQAGVGGPIKIGIADDVKKRLKQMSCGNPAPLSIMAIIDGGRDLEKALHRALYEHRLRGEWFNPADEVKAVCSMAKLKGAEPVKRWAERKIASITFRGPDVSWSDDFDHDIKQMAMFAVRHAVGRHGKQAVAEAMGKSVDVVEQMMSRHYNIPISAWVNLTILDPGACAPVYARAGDVPEWMTGDAQLARLCVRRVK